MVAWTHVQVGITQTASDILLSSLLTSAQTWLNCLKHLLGKHEVSGLNTSATSCTEATLEALRCDPLHKGPGRWLSAQGMHQTLSLIPGVAHCMPQGLPNSPKIWYPSPGRGMGISVDDNHVLGFKCLLTSLIFTKKF